MDVLSTILEANDGAAVGRIAQSLGVPQETATTAIQALLPALLGGLQRNAGQPGGMEALTGALATGNHQRYLNSPDLLAQPEGVADGNAILGHIFGSKDVSRNTAGYAAAQTGIDPGILKRLLPMLAPLVLAALSSHAATSAVPAQGAGGGGMAGALMGMLDSNRDGSPVDDLLNLAKRFF
ncbi:MAG: DUF937 domain-containing protein [Dehalococcoidia bacterium]